MNRNDPRAQRTRKMIINAFVELLSTKNAQAITVKELVTAAGLSRATFYLHFEDIPSFLKELTDETVGQLVQYAVYGEESKTHSGGFYVRFFDYILERQDLFRGMLGVHGYPPFRQKFIEYGVEGYSRQLKPHREMFEDQVSLDLLTYYIASAHTGIVERWLNDGCKYSSQYMAKQIQYLTVEGLKPIAALKDELELPH